jgi:folate-dependent phosphoribosylglycinamide formyltransferase PurN
MKKLVRAQAGVKLERIEHLAARQKRAVCFKLTSHRNTPERLIADEQEAQRAFAREVAASLEDKVVQGLIASGYLDH